MAALSDKVALTTGMRKVFKMVEAGKVASAVPGVSRPKKRRKKAVSSVASKKISSFFEKKPVSSDDVVVDNEEVAGRHSVPSSSGEGGGSFKLDVFSTLSCRPSQCRTIWSETLHKV